MDALASSVNFSPVTLLSTGTIVLERWYSSRDKGPQGALHKPSKLIEPLERRIAKGEGKPSLPYIILKEHYLLRSIVAYSNVFGGGCGRGCQGLLFPHGLLLDVEKCCVVTPNNQQANNSVLGIPEPELRVGVIHDEWRFDDSTERR